MYEQNNNIFEYALLKRFISYAFFTENLREDVLLKKNWKEKKKKEKVGPM